MMKWHVSLKDENVPSQAEAGGNAFVEDGEELHNPATNLVREAIQNSLDKQKDAAAPVLVRFSIRAMDEAVVETWMGELIPHVASSWPQGLEKAKGRPRVLTVEDFHTVGLNGDTRVSSLRDAHADTNDFFYFWRAQNISPKQGQGGGSWGVGKTTYYLLSHIGTIMGLSVPSDPSSHTTVMGRCHLTEHSVANSELVYQHFGFGCDPDTKGGLAMPISSFTRIESFKKDWSINRAEESGLSIVIPYLRTDLEAKDLVRSVIAEYSYPIVSGHLEVVVSDENEENTVIDKTSIRTLGETIALTAKESQHLKMSTLLKSSIGAVDIGLQIPTSRPSSELDEGLIDMALEMMAERGYVHFRVPLEITKESISGLKEVAEDYIEVILQESDNSRNYHFFIRSGLWVKGEPGQGVPRPQRMDSLLVLHRPKEAKPSIAELLGRYEGASHRVWDATLDDDRRPTKYVDSESVRRFVRRLPNELARAIATRAESERFSLADDWFNTSSIGQGSGSQSDPKATGAGVKIKKLNLKGCSSIKAELDSKDRSKIRFSIVGREVIPELRIKIGYEQQDRARTSNLDMWSENDFVLQTKGRSGVGKVQVSKTRGLNAFVDKVDGNEIVCRNVEPSNFGMLVEGLDAERGLQWDATAWDSQGEPIRLTGGES